MTKYYIEYELEPGGKVYNLEVLANSVCDAEATSKLVIGAPIRIINISELA